MIRWDGPGGYVVAFTTRRGGVSSGPYESLNLGLLTDDEPANVEANRRRVCASVGADPERVAMNRQVHGATVNRAVAGRRGTPGDGLWTEEAELPLLKVTADCLPIALVRTNGTPGLAVLHAGRLGLLEGIVEAGVATLGRGARAVIGPGIGPCCYEVGPEVAEPFVSRFGGDVARGRNLDLWTAAERALRRAGVEQVDRVDSCTRCNPQLFFSHRRSVPYRHGTQGVIGALAG